MEVIQVLRALQQVKTWVPHEQLLCNIIKASCEQASVTRQYVHAW